MSHTCPTPTQSHQKLVDMDKFYIGPFIFLSFWVFIASYNYFGRIHCSSAFIVSFIYLFIIITFFFFENRFHCKLIYYFIVILTKLVAYLMYNHNT